MIYDDVTLVLQGPITTKMSKGMSRGIKNLEIYAEFGNIIVSTWKGQEIKPTKRYLSKFDADIMESEPSLYKNMYNNANMNFQVASTLNGLKKVDTKYVVKLRSDESYSDLSKLIQKIKDNPEKIVTNNIFFSKNDYEPFHPSDHVIGGTTKNLLSMFSYAFNVCLKEYGTKQLTSDYFNIPKWRNRDGDNRVSPEVFLCFCYLKSKKVEIDLEKSAEIMKKYYDVVPVTDMGRFFCKYDINVIDNNNYYEIYKNKLPNNFIHSMGEL